MDLLLSDADPFTGREKLSSQLLNPTMPVSELLNPCLSLPMTPSQLRLERTYICPSLSEVFLRDLPKTEVDGDCFSRNVPPCLFPESDLPNTSPLAVHLACSCLPLSVFPPTLQACVESCTPSSQTGNSRRPGMEASLRQAASRNI